MGDNGGVRALGRSTTVRIGAVLLVLSLVAVLTIVVRNAVRYREAVALDEAGDAQAQRALPGRPGLAVMGTGAHVSDSPREGTR